ncbi:MAG: class I SAM-dependent methyltransferase [Dehalococcoidia bacterium]
MNKDVKVAVNYGNWVSKWLIYIPAALALVFIGLSWASYWLYIPAVFFIIVFTYFAYAYNKFSAMGGDLQTKIRDLVLGRLEWDGQGRVLDIGCGNGAIVVKLARKYPAAHVTGIDYWGGKWGFSKAACENNAGLERVDRRCEFLKASASSLPFDDGYFDAAVSNFVFHEVKDSKDKRKVIREALRVLKNGGSFAFQDLFLYKRVYGDIDDLLETIKSWGIREVEFINTNREDFIPPLLKLPFMLGSIGIIYGRK